MTPKLLTSLFLTLVILPLACLSPKDSFYPKSKGLHRYQDSSYAQFQKLAYHPKRTIAYLKTTLDSLAQSVTGILNDARVKPKVLARSLSFFVLPSGRFKRNSFSDYPKNDSQTLKDQGRLVGYHVGDSLLSALADSITACYRTDSIPDYKPYLYLLGHIGMVSTGLVFSFVDESYYASGLTGGRSRASIMRVVMVGLRDLKDAYNRTLKHRQGIKGKITVKFAIDEFGKVIFAEAETPGTTIDDTALVNEFVAIVKTWKFERIQKPGDVTEVVYPFVLSQ